MMKCAIHSYIYYVHTILEISRKVIITSQKTMPISSSLEQKLLYTLVNRKNRLQLMFTQVI